MIGYKNIIETGQNQSGCFASMMLNCAKLMNDSETLLTEQV